MEIPYIVNPRKDTGLTNSKIAIWLFLASEVMLFGGLFSSYIFLRVYADFPWPERALPVLPGLINTFILIASSVTVVFAWAALKLRKWGMFVANMSFTLVCAAVFMVFKVYEYKAKFSHHGIQYNDFSFVEGHLHPTDEQIKNHYAADCNVINAKSVNVSLNSYIHRNVQTLLDQAKGVKMTLVEPYVIRKVNGDSFEDVVLFAKGSELTLEVLDKAKAEYIKARTHNQKLRTDLNRAAFVQLRDPEQHPELVGVENHANKFKKEALPAAFNALVKQAEANNQFLIENGNMTFTVKDATFHLPYNWGRMIGQKKGEDSSISLLDGTVISGKAGDSSINLAVDALDFRHLVMRAENLNQDADTLIEKSPLLNIHGDHHGGGDQLRKIWAAHKQWRTYFGEYLAKEYGNDSNGNPKRVPTAVDKYRVTWQQMVSYHRLKYVINENNWRLVNGGKGTGEFANHERIEPTMIEGFTGPDHYNAAFKPAFPHIEIPRHETRFESDFSPKMNNYYAIYFTITGLHGLHVIGGAIVLGYYLFFGRKMFLANPDWLANRVEVGGLFWHFVDLVWIFVFPIFYLM